LENKTGKWKNCLSFETWNFRTLFKSRTVQCLIEDTEKNGLEVLQEIRWNDKGTMDIQNTTIFYDECNEQRQFGTGFTVHKNIVP